MLRLTVNGKPHQAREGAMLLETLRKLGIDVPTLCHDDRLKPYGGCRLCCVSVVGMPRLVSACSTPVWEGMVVETHSQEAESSRRNILGMLAEAFPKSDGLDEDLELIRYLRSYGIAPSGGVAGATFHDALHPYIGVDMDRCVYCYRCVRICEEVQGQFVWRVWNRGDRTRIRPAGGHSLMESPCVSCGACVDTCPSGALQDVTRLKLGEPERWTKTTCPYCGVGCEIEVGTRGSEVVASRPAMDSPVNKGHLCVKGRYAFRFAHHKDRITEPMIREKGGWRQASWKEAFAFIAERLTKIIQESGPDSVGVLGSARATNEENYLAQKFARVAIGTNNVDCCARVCHGPSAAALKITLGTGAATNSFDDIELAAGFLLAGCNPTENHPVVGARIRQAVLKGAKLVVIDPRKTELAELADVHLALRPGSNVPVLHAIAHVMIEEGFIDREFVEARTSGLESFKAFVAEWTPERAAELAEISAEDIRRAARIYGQAKPAMIFHGLGMTEHVQGVDGVRCLVNLALITGNLGRPGSGENPLRGQNNVQGSAHMGCEPNHLAGYAPIREASANAEAVWGAPVPTSAGLNWMQMVDASAERRLRALYAIGYDVYLSNPNSNSTATALEKLDLLIVQDLFLNETARAFGHVFLPVCSSYEKDGTFMNSERRVQRVRKAIDPHGESKADWQVICELADALGKGSFFEFSSPEAIWEEVRKLWKPGAGISYGRIEQQGLQWPCPAEDHPGTAILHAKTFPIGQRAAFSEIPFQPTPECTDMHFPLLLTTGRTLLHFNAGTMTYRTENAQLLPTDMLSVSEQDAKRLNLKTGDSVRVTSRYGAVEMPLSVSATVRPGLLFATFHDPKVFTNRLTSSFRDPITDTPEYKVAAVRLERA